MRFPTNLLAIFGYRGAQMDARDGVLEVPRVLSPVVELPETVIEGLYDDHSAVTMRTSFSISGFQNAVNGAGFVHGVKLSEGVWDIHGNWNYITDYTDIASNPMFSIGINILGTGNNYDWASAWPVNGVPQRGDFKVRLAMKQSGNILYWSHGASGPAQRYQVSIGVLCNRLG